jgi:hypothetical protein
VDLQENPFLRLILVLPGTSSAELPWLDLWAIEEKCCCPFGQLAVAACRPARGVPLPWAVSIQVNEPAAQAAGRLFTICPDMAKLLAVLALRKDIP